MRHGRAEVGAPGQPDHERSLTPEGLVEVQQIASALPWTGWHVPRLFSSPYRRAQQTADALVRELGCPFQEAPALIPGFRMGELVAALNPYPDLEAAFIVTHQPSIGQVVASLTGSRLMIAPATIVVVDVSRLRSGGGTLRGCYEPSTMANLGRFWQKRESAS